MARKKPESMLTRQRRLLKEQRAKKAAAKAAKSKTSRTLPSRGQTGGNSLKSRAQRKGTAKRVAGQQQRVISEAMRKTMKQRQALDKKEAAAKGTKGTKVQTGTRTKGGALARQGSSTPTRSRKGAAASTRVEKVKVRVEPQKSLKAGSQKALPPAKNSLPAGKKGGPLASTKGPRRRNINGNPSKGTQMGTKGSAKAQLRLPKGSIRSAGAASKALSTTGKVAGRIALPLAAYSEGKGLYDSLKRGEGYARLPGMIGRALKGNGKKKTTGAKTNSRGRRVGAVPASKTKPAKTTKSNNASAINERLKKQKEERAARLARTRGGSNSAILRSAPGKGDPKKTPTRSSAPTPTPTRKPTPTRSSAPTKPSTKKEPTKRQPRTWLADNYKPGKGPKRYSTPGKTNNKLTQSKRMADALKNLKVRKYKK